ncbi:MAG: hypothetical protein RL748_3880 [Pseudomonadota bacterium]|jgi:MSHA biogenesis protein MshJ
MKQWQEWIAKLDAITLRERVLVFAAVVAVMVVILNTLIWKPAQLKQKTFTSDQRQAQAEMLAARLEIDQKLSLFAVDPDRDNKQRLETLKKEYERIYNNLGEQQKGLVAPEKVPELLQSVLKQNTALHLLSLKTIDSRPKPTPAPEANGRVLGIDAVQQLFAKIHAPQEKAASAAASVSASASASATAKVDNKPPEKQEGPIFRHGVVLEVEGNYLDLMEYLVALEKLPQQVYWGNLQLNVKKHPRATMSVEIFTLSLDRKWLNL